MLGWLAATLSLSPLMLGHVIPDNVVYRGIQVIVQPDGIEVHYQLGLNENTLRRELASRQGRDAGIPADDEAALATFRDVILPLLPHQLDLKIDGEVLPLVPVRVDLLRQHHAQIECVYRSPFPAQMTPSRLTLVDENFAETPGVQIIAVKARGDIDLLQSDAPTLLVRAQVNRWEASDTAVPSAASRRLEAYFCRSTPLPEMPQPAPASADGTSTPTPGASTGTTAEGSRPQGFPAGSHDLSEKHAWRSTAILTTVLVLALLVILIYVGCSRRAPRRSASPG